MKKDLQSRELVTQLLAGGCYGAECAFSQPICNPLCMHLQCTCVMPGVVQGHVNSH